MLRNSWGIDYAPKKNFVLYLCVSAGFHICNFLERKPIKEGRVTSDLLGLTVLAPFLGKTLTLQETGQLSCVTHSKIWTVMGDG